MKPDIPGYRILGKLGEGGMGIVFRALQVGLGREVALKVLMVGEGDLDLAATKRFHREARALSRVDHPHVVALYDFGVAADVAYYAMEICEGRSLDARLKADGPMPWRDVLRLLGELAGGLAVCHRAGILHRDIKPANVLLGTDGRALLTDFGLVRIAGTRTALTRTGIIPGTPRYLPPEVLRRGVEATAASDLYQLGLVAYEACLGRGPYEHIESLQELGRAILRDSLDRLSTRVPDLPSAPEGIIHRCLAKSPDERFASAEELHEACRDIDTSAGDPTPGSPATPTNRPRPVSGWLPPASRVTPPPRLLRTATGRRLAGAGIVGVAVLIVATLSLRRPAPPAEAHAVRATVHADRIDLTWRSIRPYKGSVRLRSGPSVTPDVHWEEGAPRREHRIALGLPARKAPLILEVLAADEVAWEGEVGLAPGPGLVPHDRVVVPRLGGLRVRWRSDEAYLGCVTVSTGREPGHGPVFEAGPPTTRHQVDVDGLAGGVRVTYRLLGPLAVGLGTGVATPLDPHGALRALTDALSLPSIHGELDRLLERGLGPAPESVRKDVERLAAQVRALSPWDDYLRCREAVWTPGAHDVDSRQRAWALLGRLLDLATLHQMACRARSASQVSVPLETAPGTPEVLPTPECSQPWNGIPPRGAAAGVLWRFRTHRPEDLSQRLGLARRLRTIEVDDEGYFQRSGSALARLFERDRTMLELPVSITLEDPARDGWIFLQANMQLDDGAGLSVSIADATGRRREIGRLLGTPRAGASVVMHRIDPRVLAGGPWRLHLRYRRVPGAGQRVHDVIRALAIVLVPAPPPSPNATGNAKPRMPMAGHR